MFEKHVPLAKQIWKVGLPATPRPACMQASTAMRSIPSKPLARATPRTAKEATRKIIFRSTMLRFPTSKRRCDILLAGKIVGAGTCSTRLRSKSGPVSIMWRSTTTDASHHAMLRCRRGTSALSGAQHVGLIDGNEVRAAACGLPTLYSVVTTRKSWCVTIICLRRRVHAGASIAGRRLCPIIFLSTGRACRKP